MSRIPLTFKIGDIVNSKQINKEFRCSPYSGMNYSSTYNALVLYSYHEGGLYDDRWKGDILHYTGMGRNGDMEMTGQNLRLKESPNTDLEIHLFEVFEPTEYTYRGEFVLCDDPYPEFQEDENKNMRRVWMFPIKAKNQDIGIPFDQFKKNEENRKKSALKDGRKKKTPEELVKAARNKHPRISHRKVQSDEYERDQQIAEASKALAKGVCLLCKTPAPFKDKDGAPYLESHHIIWLSKGGADELSNTAALCPNCHRKMHVVADPEDVKKLQSIIKEKLKAFDETGKII